MFDRTGQPAHRYAYIGLPRKNGKSTLGAALAIYALMCLGPAAHVYSCAGDRKQASIVFDEAKRMVRADPHLSAEVRIQRWHLEGPGDSIYRVLSADAELQQGLNPSFVIFDEVHVQPNRDLWDAMTLGMGTRANPMMVGITTAGYDRGTLAWDLYEQGQRGELYFWWREPADPACDWRDPAVWAEANPAYGDFLRPEALAEDVRITPESAFRRFHLNQWTTTQTAWLPHGAWAGAEDLARTVPDGAPVVLGFDGSWTRDSTALVGCTIADPHLFVIAVWERDTADPAWRVPAGEVEAALAAAMARYDVREIAADPPMWREQLARWSESGWPVFEWPTNSLPRIVPACAEFYAAVMERRLTHDGNPALARHIANAVVKTDRFGMRIVKDTDKRKIDLAVASIIAYDRAHQQVDPGPSVYKTRGIAFV